MPTEPTHNSRLATLDQLLEITLPQFISPPPTRETLRAWFDAAASPGSKRILWPRAVAGRCITPWPTWRNSSGHVSGKWPMKKNCVICRRSFEGCKETTCSEACHHQRWKAYKREYQRKWLLVPGNLEKFKGYLAKKKPQQGVRYCKLCKSNFTDRVATKRYCQNCSGSSDLRDFIRARARYSWHKRKPIRLISDNHKSQHALSARESKRRHSPTSKASQTFFLSMKLGEAVKQQQNYKMKNPVTTQIPTVQQFIESFTGKLKGIEDSCRELAAMVEANPNVFDEIVAADPRFNYNMLESMKKVGKGDLYCELLFDPSMASRKLLPLPFAQQRKLYNEPTKIVKSIGGKNVVEEKMLQKMSRHELTLVIDEEKGRARTVEEQIAFVKPPTPAKRAERYQIIDGKIKVLAETEFTVAQWIEIGERAKAVELKALPEAMKANQLRS